MPATTIALEAIADAAVHNRYGILDDANELAIRLLVCAGVTPELDSEIEELQALLVEAILRNPALAGFLEQVAK